MFWKYLPIVTLLGHTFAQQDSQSLNATLSSNENLSSLRTFLSADPTLIQALSQARNVTILAPNNEAFERAAQLPGFAALANSPQQLASVLLYHVLNGTIRAEDITNTSAFVPTYLTRNLTASNVTEGQVVEAVKQGNQTSFYSGLLSRANVTQANVNFTGGVIHVIDSVLSPPVDLLETANAFNLTSLRGALNATGLATSLVNTPDLTIFAPNNEAFTNINSALSGLNNETLQNILAHHVVNGTVAYSTLLQDGQNVTAADGRNLTITIRNGTVFVNQARVVTANVLVANGVVHVIDSVLNPQNATTPDENVTSGVVAYPSATRSGNGVPFTSGQPTPTITVSTTTPASTGQASGTGQTQGGGSPAAASRPVATGVGYTVALGVAAAWFL